MDDLFLSTSRECCERGEQVKLALSEMHSGIALWGRQAPEQASTHTYAGHLVMFPSNWGMFDLCHLRHSPDHVNA